MFKYISAASGRYTEISIQCTYYRDDVENPAGNGSYWDESLLTATIQKVLSRSGYAIRTVNMYEVPDLLEDDPDWFDEDAPDGMSIQIICNEYISDEATCEYILDDLSAELNKIQYEVVDISYGSVDI